MLLKTLPSEKKILIILIVMWASYQKSYVGYIFMELCGLIK